MLLFVLFARLPCLQYIGGQVQEASYIYQELGDKFGWTVRMSYCVIYVCYFHMPACHC
jgi:hypothetical protein